ncbi:MAG: hypothetical protein QS721_01460 [Candidatus Endonucleobacter sp. (ex Gigantidas childressi)]|nr:hypothetical protein [Candidatus Endonucleobacter sp. (ex Gigantidas childressi)]
MALSTFWPALLKLEKSEEARAMLEQGLAVQLTCVCLAEELQRKAGNKSNCRRIKRQF